MSGKCKDCRFWDAEYVRDFIEPRGWGSCGRADLQEYPESLMDVEAGWLKTAPEFGCSQWAEKESRE